MNSLPPPLARLIAELAKLPGIGRKTAQRLALHLLVGPRADSAALAGAIAELHDNLRFCAECFGLSEGERCLICADPRRDRSRICVVEQPSNLLVLERTGSYNGLYHVLGGALSPLENVGPDDLRIQPLIERIGRRETGEVVLATNPDVEGEATAVFLARLLKPLGVRVSRLAQGMPAGGDLEFTDDLTIRRALEGRREF